MHHYEAESKICSKTTISTVNSLHICWNLDVTFTLSQARSHGVFRGSVPKFFCAPQILLCLEKFVLNIHLNKNKNLASLTIYFALQTRVD